MGFKLVFLICGALAVNGTLKAHMELFREAWLEMCVMPPPLMLLNLQLL